MTISESKINLKNIEIWRYPFRLTILVHLRSDQELWIKNGRNRKSGGVKRSCISSITFERPNFRECNRHDYMHIREPETPI